MKNSLRKKRGKGIRRKLHPQTTVPSNFKGILRNSKNKIEFFDFLTKTVSDYQFGNHKEVYITTRNAMSTATVAENNSMDICTHEETDKRMVIHILDASETRIRKIIILTVDSDITTIMLEKFELVSKKYNDLHIYIGFGKDKDNIIYNVNEKFENLEP